MAENPAGELGTADRNAFFTDPADSDDLKVYRRVRDQRAVDLLSQLVELAGGSPGGATVSNIANVPCTIPNQEYSYTLPPNCKAYVLKARGNSSIKLTYSTGAASYLTIEPGAVWSEKNDYTNQTIYFRCTKADEVVEIVTHV